MNLKTRYCYIGALRYRIEVQKGEEGRRPGRHKTTWRRMIEEEHPAVGWQSWPLVRALATNRSGRRKNVKAMLRHVMACRNIGMGRYSVLQELEVKNERH